MHPVTSSEGTLTAGFWKCVQPGGCIVVDFLFIVISGTVMLLMAITVIVAIVFVVGAIGLPADLHSVPFGSTDILSLKTIAII